MSTRTIRSLSGGHLTVDPRTDELILAGRKDQPSVSYFLRVQGSTHAFYAYRPRQRVYGEDLSELCEAIAVSELQAEILRIAAYDPLEEYADTSRLRALGLHVPELRS